MFEIGWTELLIIGVVAILVVPPKDLPVLMRTIGKYMGQLRRMAGEFRAQFDDAMRDAEMKELQDQLRQQAREIEKLNPMTEAEKSVNDSIRKLDASTPVAAGAAAASAPEVAAEITASAPADAPAAAAVVSESTPAPAIVAAVEPAAAAAREPVAIETQARPTVAERAAQAWKKAAGADSGA